MLAGFSFLLFADSLRIFYTDIYLKFNRTLNIVTVGKRGAFSKRTGKEKLNCPSWSKGLDLGSNTKVHGFKSHIQQ